MKECGSCGLCCKVMAIKELKKPGGTWCPHWEKGTGCTIYGTRPQECKDFNCIWLVSKQPLPSLFPKKCKAVIAASHIIPEVKSIGIYKDDTFQWSKNPELDYFRNISKIPVFIYSNTSRLASPGNEKARIELLNHNLPVYGTIEDDFDGD